MAFVARARPCIHYGEEADVKQHIRKWGNSAVVRIPADVLAAVGLKTGDLVKVSAEPGRIYIDQADAERLR